jgi:hypothetical protein
MMAATAGKLVSGYTSGPAWPARRSAGEATRGFSPVLLWGVLKNLAEQVPAGQEEALEDRSVVRPA